MPFSKMSFSSQATFSAVDDDLDKHTGLNNARDFFAILRTTIRTKLHAKLGVSDGRVTERHRCLHRSFVLHSLECSEIWPWSLVATSHPEHGGLECLFKAQETPWSELPWNDRK